MDSFSQGPVLEKKRKKIDLQENGKTPVDVPVKLSTTVAFTQPEASKSSKHAAKARRHPDHFGSRAGTLTLLPALGAALKKTWDANASAGGYNFPPEWDPKATYRDGHVFSDGTFIEDGQLCKPLGGGPQPSQAFRPVARPKSNFAAYEALFGGKGPSGLKGTRTGSAATPEKDLLPRELDAKLRDSLGLGPDLEATPRNKPDPSSHKLSDGPGKPSAALEDMVARANNAPASLPDPFSTRRSELERIRRATTAAAAHKKHGPPTRPCAGPLSSRPPPAPLPGRRPHANAISGKLSVPFVGLCDASEIYAARLKAMDLAAQTGIKEDPFARVAARSTPARRKRWAPPSVPADQPWSAVKEAQVRDYLRRQLLAPQLMKKNLESMSAPERRMRRRQKELDEALQLEERGVMRKEREAQRARWVALARETSKRRVKRALEEGGQQEKEKEKGKRAVLGEGRRVGRKVEVEVEAEAEAEEGMAYDEDVEEEEEEEEEEEDEEGDEEDEENDDEADPDWDEMQM